MLCSRPLDQVFFAATHNSYAASAEPGWHFANQTYPIPRQLDDGIRALLIDVHYGVSDPATGRVRTDFAAEGADRNKVAKQVPPRRCGSRTALRVASASASFTASRASTSATRSASSAPSRSGENSRPSERSSRTTRSRS